MSLSWPNKGARRHAFVGGELALALPAPQRLRRDPKELGGFVNADHLARYDHNIHYCTKTSNFFLNSSSSSVLLPQRRPSLRGITITKIWG